MVEDVLRFVFTAALLLHLLGFLFRWSLRRDAFSWNHSSSEICDNSLFTSITTSLYGYGARRW